MSASAAGGPPTRYAPAWLRPGLGAALPRQPGSVAVEAARRAALVGVPGRRADARARDAPTSPTTCAAAARMGGVEARSPLLDLRARRVRPAHPARDELRSGHLATARARGAAWRAARRRPRARATSATSRRCTTGRSSGPENLERMRHLLDERRAAVGAYVDLRRLRRDHLDRPPAVGEPGWRPWAVHVWNVVTAELWLRDG